MTNNLMLILDNLFVGSLFLKALLFLPQLWRLWRAKKADQLSLMTFIGMNFMQALTLIHGYYHNDYRLMLGIGVNLLVCGTITVLIIIYSYSRK